MDEPAAFAGRIDDLPEVRISDHSTKRLVVGKDLLGCIFRHRKGVRFAPHSHPHEQLTYVLEGSHRMRVGGKERILKTGELAYVPPDVEHEVEMLEDNLLLEVYSPIREDFL
ncbi:MAG: cupin domain-containing protein [Nitrospinota bacterium]|nr:cupin domain-containing protein [Nitrospinota bacterium]